MGHIRIGRLPKIRKWRQVISLLNSPSTSPREIARATAEAAEDFFAKRKSDPALAYSYWLLTQIANCARSENFVSELNQIGVDITDVRNTFDFLSLISDFTHKQVKERSIPDV